MKKWNIWNKISFHARHRKQLYRNLHQTKRYLFRQVRLKDLKKNVLWKVNSHQCCNKTDLKLDFRPGTYSNHPTVSMWQKNLLLEWGIGGGIFGAMGNRHVKSILRVQKTKSLKRCCSSIHLFLNLQWLINYYINKETCYREIFGQIPETPVDVETGFAVSSKNIKNWPLKNPNQPLWGSISASGLLIWPEWREKYLALGQGSSEERFPVVSWFSELPFLDVPGTATEQVRTCGFRRNSSSFDNAPKIRESVLLNSFESFLVTLPSISAETWEM